MYIVRLVNGISDNEHRHLAWWHGGASRMKVTKAQVQANRAHIVDTAAALFRERGYDGVGIAELMTAAGFTHGGFYKHFSSKADLLAEAAAVGIAQTTARADGVDAKEFVARYLSREHRDAPGQGCTMAALCADAARQPEPVRAAFSAGIENLLATLQHEHGMAAEAPLKESVQGEAPQDNTPQDDALRATHIAIIAQMVGAMVMSRSCPDDSALADEVLEACRAAVVARLHPHPGA